MDDLCEFLISHMIIDFDGEVDHETITRFLVEDRSQLSQILRGRLLADHGSDDFRVVLGDCLRESLRTGMTPAKVREQIEIYVES